MYLIIKPFLIVFGLIWYGFCLLIIYRPYAWIEFQNRHSRPYGLEWRIIDEDKFVRVHKTSGVMLFWFGTIFLIAIIRGWVILGL